MATSFNPFGLRAVNYMGAKPRFSTFNFPFYTTLTEFYNGSVYALNSVTPGHLNNLQDPTGGAAVSDGVLPNPSVSATPVGVFISCEYQPITGAPVKSKWWPAGTTVVSDTTPSAIMDCDPMQIYDVQCNGALSVSSTSLPIGQTFNLEPTGNSVQSEKTGNSLQYIDVAQVYDRPDGTTSYGNSGQVRILGLSPENPAWGTNEWDDPYPVVQVILNNTLLKVGQYSL